MKKCPPKGVSGSSHKAPDNNPGQPIVQGTDNPIAPGFSQQLAEFVRVSILGDKNGRKMIEEFEGATGYHIRTIPAYRRYFNPVAIGAGGGQMVVVDRFGAGDVLRVTDPKSNAPSNAFDTDGFPVDSFDWSSVQDSLAINIADVMAVQGVAGVGTFVRGISILPRGFMIALLDGGFMVWDIIQQYPQHCRIFPLPDAFQGFTFNGNPGAFNQLKTASVYYATAPANSPEGASCLLFLNYVKGTVDYAIPGPDAPVIAGTLCGEVASIWTATDHVNCDQVTRLQFSELNYFGSGPISQRTLPDPKDKTVNTTFNVLDDSTDPAFLDFINRGPGKVILSPTEESTTGGGTGRPLASPASTTALNLGRTSVVGIIKSSLPLAGSQVEIRAKIVATNPADLVRAAASLFNTVVEMNTLPTDLSNDDVKKPLYRLIHGTNFDYLSDGGFVYGCFSAPDQDHPNGSVTPVNDAMFPISVALDRSNEKGRLKEPPDAKFALVDVKTGLILPEDPIKSLGRNIYAGSFACLKTVLQNSLGFTRASDTPCTQVFWTEQEGIDGMHRAYADPANAPVSLASQVQPHVITPASPTTAPVTDHVPPLDTPWSCFQPRIVPPNRLMAGAAEPNWTRKDDQGGFLDGWINASERMVPHVEVGTASQMHYPAASTNTHTPSFAASCRSGFFLLDWQKQRVDGPPDGLGHPTVSFQTPSSILETLSGPMDVTPAQTEPGVPEAVVLPIAAPQRPALLQSGTGLAPHADLRRLVGFDTNIRSWVGIEIDLERGASLTDGVAGWRQPASLENGLGVPVGPGVYNAAEEAIICGPGPVGARAGSAYDTGDTANDGAAGAWEIDVFFNNVPATRIATKVSFPEQIQYLAPGEAQDLLNNDFNASGASDLGFHKGRVYFSPEVIKTVTVKARLVNYAFGVFRVGFHTITFAHNDFFGGFSYCPGTDPGFNAGNNCEAPCCGNVACASQVLFGNKLYASDPTRPVVVNVLWEGSATYSIPDGNNPYLLNGMQVGYLFDVFLSFNLNGPMSGWDINLRAGSSGRSPSGTGF